MQDGKAHSIAAVAQVVNDVADVAGQLQRQGSTKHPHSDVDGRATSSGERDKTERGNRDR